MQKFFRPLTLIAAALCFIPTAPAEYMRPDTERVPTARLIASLEEKVKARPADVELRYALARVHSIAYATQAGEFEVHKTNQLPHFGFGSGSDRPPRETKQPTNEEKQRQATEHLRQAIQHYKEVLKAKPDHVFAQLGLGWCLDQSGDKPAALVEYRKALELAWAKERKAEGFEIGVGSATDEIARYMLKLLNAKKDADEIKKIEGYTRELSKKGRWITPILLPLEAGTPLDQLVNPRANVAFDLDGSGLDRRWGWITPQAAWLVFDHDGRGEITSGLQMIGGVTFWVFWLNGYHALAALDNDQDGVLRGDELNGLALWHDANNNGVSEPGEVKPLAAWGITGLSCAHQTHATGIPFSPRGVTFTDGSTRPSYDWIAPGR